jgi:quercetin dioxygenase-like cupin family protein
MNHSTRTALKEVANQPATELQFADLLTSQLQGVENTEVVVSITTVPPHTKLPTHWHPGEEFAYVLDGSFTLHQEDKPDEHYKKGDVGIVPLKQVHTVSTQDDSARILIFRVHELGQPGRVLVD